MRGYILILFLIYFSSCIFYRRWYEEQDFIETPNWTPENNILFIEIYRKIEITQNRLTGEKWISGGESYVYLWEVDLNENYRKIGTIFKDRDFFPNALSVAGEWVLISGGDIYALKRDLSEIKYLGKGDYADLSPDGKKFVYVKKGQGLWIKNIDGTGDHCIVPDSNATHPAWSTDGGRVAYILKTLVSLNTDSLIIIDTLNNLLNKYELRIYTPDWGPSEFNAISFSNGHCGCILYIQNGMIDTLKNILTGDAPVLWSPSGAYFIAYDGKWYVIKRDGAEKFYIKP